MHNISLLFDDKNIMMGKLNKKSYETFMNKFREKNANILEDIFSEIDSAADGDAAIDEAGKAFAEEIFNSFSKRGKIRGGVLAELELFMIHYVFPAILLMDNPNATRVCDAIRDSWNARFKRNINYTDYETIYSGFVTKLFGVPIGS